MTVHECNNFNVIQLCLATLLTDFFGVSCLIIKQLYSSTFSPIYFTAEVRFLLIAFCVGNKRSLNDATEKGVDLREQIWKLYRDNYFGELMKLVIIGGGEISFFLLMHAIVLY